MNSNPLLNKLFVNEVTLTENKTYPEITASLLVRDYVNRGDIDLSEETLLGRLKSWFGFFKAATKSRFPCIP